jgi:segregation and condensation protein B
MIELAQLKRITEAALLAAGQPLTVAQILALFAEEEMPSHDQIAQALDELRQDSEQRGVELVEVASGFRYQVRHNEHQWVARLWTERQTRYSRALLETLALIAYRQPITRGEIEQIRGVAVSTNIIKTLEEREWVRVVGYRDVPGKPAIYGTNKNFLDYFNLKSLDQLPPLAEIHDMDDLDPQLMLGPSVAPIGLPVEIESDETSAEHVSNEQPTTKPNDEPDELIEPTSASPSSAVPESVPVEHHDAKRIESNDIADDATSLPPTSESLDAATADDETAATPEQPA